ncbi:MAG: heme biosynthesis protein HemY [Alphaproteobacteria bacterium]
MLRLLWFVVVIAALTAAAVWLADHPGAVDIRWRNYALSTSVAVLAVAVAFVAVVVAVVYHFWRWLRAGPRRMVAGRAARRRAQGYLALTKGLVAVAAGDPKSAQRYGRETGRLIDNPLNLLLLAQAAQLEGNEAAARRHFHAMLEHVETEFLGLRGLLVQATKAGDWDAALGYARRAYALRPETEWVNSALFDLEVRAGDWRGAQKTLESAARHRHVSGAEEPRRRAVLLAERARAARAEGRDDEALALAREAHRLAPGLVAASALAAELLAAAGKGRAAAKLIEDGWAHFPHPELARVYAALAPDEGAMERVKRLERLVRRNAGHAEGHIALAEAALAAELWGAARNYLEAAVRERPTQRVLRLLATLEERENADARAARGWLLRAASAPPDAAWLCDKCGAVSVGWAARCDACGAFDALAWKVPPAPVAVAAPVEPATLPAVGDAPAGEPAVVVDAAIARE